MPSYCVSRGNFKIQNKKKSLKPYPLAALSGRKSLIIMFFIAAAIFSGSVLGCFRNKLTRKSFNRRFRRIQLV